MNTIIIHGTHGASSYDADNHGEFGSLLVVQEPDNPGDEEKRLALLAEDFDDLTDAPDDEDLL